MAVFTYAKKFFYRFVEELVTVYRIQLILFTSSLTLENELFNYCEQYSFWLTPAFLFLKPWRGVSNCPRFAQSIQTRPTSTEWITL